MFETFLGLLVWLGYGANDVDSRGNDGGWIGDGIKGVTKFFS